MASTTLSPFGNAVAGAGGSVVALAAVYPLDVVKTRLQVQNRPAQSVKENNGKPYQSTLHELFSIIRCDGLAGLYAGLPAGLVGQASTNFAYFYFYSAIRGAYTKNRQAENVLSTAAELLIGAGAGALGTVNRTALAQIFTIPVSVVVTRQQTMPSNERFGFAETWAQIVREDGYRGLWKGLKPSMILVSNPAITYGFFEKLRSVIVARQRAVGVANPEKVSTLQLFLLGVLSKSIATIKATTSGSHLGLKFCQLPLHLREGQVTVQTAKG
ncbi:MAG: mitochondrial carrier domain-containing protein [Olpidium bornovanus]|uniref:Mitochondrial carrier domain-containing protein n=1 Tax=Olpidium bornovanus TaxID=278681 RepID=A0A8H7ZLX3_9FUNG|nr:MAG: mitochondrial carrier domain-containing protein [Olpidium bornovanus]